MSSNLNASMTLSIRDKWSKAAKRFRSDMKGLKSSSQKLGSEFKGLSNDAKKMAQANADASRKQLRLIDNFKQTQRALSSTRREFDRAKSEVERLKEQMRAVGPPVKGLESQLKKANATLARSKERFRATAEASLRAKNGLREAGIEVKQLAATEKRLTSSMDRATAELKEQASAARRLQSEYDRLEQRKKAVLRLTERERNRRNNRMMLGGGMAAIGAGSMIAGRQVMRPVAASANLFGGFEEAMDSVAAVARVKQGSEQYSVLSNKARELGATTSYSAIEAAQGMNFLAMAGMSPDEILASMSDVLNLAKATKTELAQTADISSNIQSGFGLDATEMGRIADVLTATTTRANVDLTMLGESMKYAAPIAKQLGVSLEETAAMAGLLGNVGIQGSMAGTSLRTIYTRLAAPNKRARSALASLKVETKDLEGNLRPVPDLLLEIAKASENMGSGQRAELFKDIVGAEAGSAFSSLIDEKGFAAFEQLLSDLKDVRGEAARVAAEMGDNWMGDKKALASAVSEIALIFGEALNPALREATQWMTEQARAIGEWLKEHPKLTKAIGFGVAALAGMLVVGGGLLTFLGSAIMLSAGLRFGLFMLGMRARTSAGAIGLIGRAISALSPIRWAKLISRLVWRSFVSPLKWATWIARLQWRGFVGVLRWASFVPRLAWRGLVSALNWSGLIKPVRWLTYLPRLAWRGILPALRWASFIPRFAWSGLLPKLSWRLLITPLTWGARLIPVIGWASLAGMLAWDFLIKPMGWDKYLPSIDWSAIVGAFKWDGWIPTVDWSAIMGAFAWPEALTSFDWSSYISGFEWSDVLLLTVPGAINRLIEAFTGINLAEAGLEAGKSMVEGIKSVFNDLIDWFKALPSRIITAIGNIDVSNLIKWPSMPSWLGGGKKEKPEAAKGFASGGSFGPGPRLVGERGPELEYVNRSGFIAHHGQLKQMAGLSRQIRRYASAGSIATAVAAIPAAASAASPVLPSLNAAEAAAARAERKIELSISVPIGSVVASDPNIEARIQTAVSSAVNEALETALSRLDDRLGD